MNQEQRKMAAAIDDLFLRLMEVMWEHISGAYVSSETISFNITEHYLMDFLGGREHATMSELSRIFHTPATTMTSIIDRLVRKGYLERGRSDQDRRKVLVKLSKKGQEFYRRHRQESLMIFGNLLSQLPDGGKKFYQSLQDMKESLNYIARNQNNKK